MEWLILIPVLVVTTVVWAVVNLGANRPGTLCGPREVRSNGFLMNGRGDTK